MTFWTIRALIGIFTWVKGEKYIVAAIPFVFGSIPVAFRRFTDEEIRKGTSQNLIENEFFLWIRDTLLDYKVVIIADRGFRRASLLKFLRQIGLHYVIRVCGNVWVSTSKTARGKYSGVLGDMKLKIGETRYLGNVSYHKTLQLSINLVMRKRKAERGKKIEPWYIATDLSDLPKAIGLYEKRMWIEEMFRDFKSRFHWCGYKVETEANLLSHGIIHYSGAAWVSSSQDWQSAYSIQLWQEQHHMAWYRCH